MTVRLIATDIDGTLLDSTDTVPPANLDAIRRASAAGVRLALVTARKLSSTQYIADLVGVPCALLSHNGARAWDWSGNELWHLTIPLQTALEVANFADEHGLPLISTVDEHNFHGPGFPRPISGVDATADEHWVRSNVEALQAAPTRMIVVGEVAIDALCDAFGTAAETLVIHRYYSRVGSLASAVLTHPRANKAHALQALCSRVALEAAEVLALGDAEADVPMLHWAGIGVAMGNGMPEALAAADWIAPGHDEAGFAVAVERFVLGTKV